jgi:ribonuclease HII
MRRRGLLAGVLVLAAVFAVVVYFDARDSDAKALTASQRARIAAALQRKDPGAVVVSDACGRVAKVSGCAVIVRHSGATKRCASWLISFGADGRVKIDRGVPVSKC